MPSSRDIVRDRPPISSDETEASLQELAEKLRAFSHEVLTAPIPADIEKLLKQLERFDRKR